MAKPMPVELDDDFGTISMADFEAMIRDGPFYSAHPSMIKLIAALVETDQPIVIKLRDTQNARSVRSAISNVARHRGIKTQTAAGPGIVAVRRIGFISTENADDHS